MLHGGASRVECRAYSGGIGSRRAESWMQCVLQATYTQDAQVTYMHAKQLMKKRGHDFVKKKIRKHIKRGFNMRNGEDEMMLSH